MSKPLPCLLFAALTLGCSQSQPAPATGGPNVPATAAVSTPPVAEATPAAKPASPRVATRKPGATIAYVDELADWDRKIAASIKRAEAQPTSLIAAEAVAGSYLTRARLSGSYDDYASAQLWVDKGFQCDPSGRNGPFGTRASLNFTLHRLDRVDGDFADAQRGKHDNITESGHKLFAANLALQRGDLKAAGPLFDASIALHPSVGNLSAKAYYVLGMGRPDEAEALYRQALDMYHGATREPAAWLHLQLGLLDLGRGRWDDALAHYRDAEAKLSGYWLIDEHIAEILTLQGKTDEAMALYLDIIARTDNPEFMDAVAGILLAQDKADEAKVYIERADARFRVLSARYPEAAYGHALDHYLEFGDDLAHVVELAEKNHALRPNPDAKQRLAQAYRKAGRIDDAKRVITQALASGWTTADLHAEAAEVLRAAGDTKAADAELAKARAIDPHAGA
ncbi:MAG: tetratricopeptide repeat protein [Deltaproteobacteria bacterium]|nr:tetratricopeptide repeat protein [Deltaproteobacteria bacterium]